MIDIAVQPYLIFALGAIGGSFIAMLCYRLPLIENQLEQYFVKTISAGQTPLQSPKTDINLFFPRSFCPYCKKSIAWYYNIPLLGYWLSRLRCQNCQQAISGQYFVVELLCTLLAIALYQRYGFTAYNLVITISVYIAFALALIDWQHKILPNVLTQLLLWTGLLHSVFFESIASTDAILGAVLGYSFLWFLYHMLRLITGKEGIGYGDFHLLAAIGAWLGWKALPILLLLATLCCLLTVICLVALRKSSFSDSFAFGFFLAMAYIAMQLFDQWSLLV